MGGQPNGYDAGGNPYGGNPYGGNPYGGSPYGGSGDPNAAMGAAPDSASASPPAKSKVPLFAAAAALVALLAGGGYFLLVKPPAGNAGALADAGTDAGTAKPKEEPSQRPSRSRRRSLASPRPSSTNCGRQDRPRFWPALKNDQEAGRSGRQRADDFRRSVRQRQDRRADICRPRSG